MTSKRVLIADDEECMRISLEYIISAAGHEPILACDGTDALMKYTSSMNNPPTIDLLITDLLMPGLNGTDLISKVVQINPFLPIIVMSGQQDIESVQPLVYTGSWELIQKPFRRSELLEAIDRALKKAAILKTESHKYEVINSLIQIERKRSNMRRP